MGRLERVVEVTVNSCDLIEQQSRQRASWLIPATSVAAL